MQDGPDRAFVHKELMHVSEDTQVRPDWVSEWKQLHIIFVTPSGHKNHALPGENEAKKMITTSMLKRQVWMADDGEFGYIVKNSQRVPRLNDQCENYPYIEEFTKGCNVHGTYILEG